eukprot:TRINITY_DN20771_c0_g2_i1.p1 TRINITY_DN20771_c0_g2~~TRINITY_DN20771_c0_g2_i1.p1  ORF type:complete len:375 (+),score=103.78 TRINITY_DN20771_c0_g2_i1:93-1217(+)
MAQYAPSMGWQYQGQAHGFQQQVQLLQQTAMLGAAPIFANPGAWLPGPTAWPQAAWQQPVQPCWPDQPGLGGSTGVQDPAFEALLKDLDIQPSEMDDFAWIAEYGTKDDALPAAWTKHWDAATGCVYYVDGDSQASSWQSPLLPCLRRVLQEGRQYLAQPSQDFFEQRKVSLWKRLKADLEPWYGPLESPDGRPYYANSQSGASSWRDPRVEAQWFFELEAGLLDGLADALPAPEELEVPGFGCREAAPGFGSREEIPWQSDSGAEVLTLESPQAHHAQDVHQAQEASPPAAKGLQLPLLPELQSQPQGGETTPRARVAAALQESKAEQKSALKGMIAAVCHFDEVLEAEEELQRRRMQQAAKARALRRGAPAA